MQPTKTQSAISTNSAKRLRAALNRLSPLSKTRMVELTMELLAEIEPGERDLFLNDFSVFAHNHQLPPEFASNGEPWTTWLILGGRGSGKTRAGAEWVRATALNDPKARIALLGETERDT